MSSNRSAENAFKNIEFKRSTLLVMSGFSGVGKSTVCSRIIEQLPQAGFSISATTRKPRDNEIEGKDYFFVSRPEFQRMISNNELLEYEEVHGQFYGTPRRPVDEARKQPGLFLFDVDVYGGLTLKKSIPDSILLFLEPPDLEELKKRLEKRDTEDKTGIEKRLSRIPREMELSAQYEYRITNKDLDNTLQEIADIVNSFQTINS